MRRTVVWTVTAVFILTLGLSAWAQSATINGMQTRGQGSNGTLQSASINLPEGGRITSVNCTGDGFWIEGGGKTYRYPVAQQAVGKYLPAGSYKAFPNLKVGQNQASVSVTVGWGEDVRGRRGR